MARPKKPAFPNPGKFGWDDDDDIVLHVPEEQLKTKRLPRKQITVAEMATIQKELMLGLEPTIKGKDADAYRETLSKELLDIQARGNTPELPSEWPDEPTPEEHAEMDRNIALMFPNGIDGDEPAREGSDLPIAVVGVPPKK